MWFQANDGAKFWMQVLTDLKQRGVQDILICCVEVCAVVCGNTASIASGKPFKPTASST